MNTTYSWLRACLICFLALSLGACAYGVCPGGSATPLASVPALGANFKPIPLRVAIYVAPQVLESHAVYDNYANSKYHYVIDFGRTGPAVAAAVAKYVPMAFRKAYLVTHFPDRRLVGKPIDAVFVVEHVVNRRQESARGQAIWHVTLSGGLYRIDGTPIARYAVTTAWKPKLRTFDAATPAWVAWETKNSTAAIGPAVRLLLWRFPRRRVTDYLTAHANATHRNLAAARNHTTYWRRRDGAFAGRIARDRPTQPVPTMTLLAYAKLLNSRDVEAKARVLASELEGVCTDMTAQQYPGLPLAYEHQMAALGGSDAGTAEVYATQYRTFVAGRDMRKTTLQFRRLAQHRGAN